MRNIVTYMAEEQRTFAESPFNPVDSLVFSTLAYLNYEVAPGLNAASSDSVLLHDVVMLSDWRELTAHSWMEDAKDTVAFLHVLSASRRMRDVRVAFYANERSEAVEKQFSAVTLMYPDAHSSTAYLAFRGTDGSFAGWKEDFNLCFKEVIPSQCTAAAYLSGVASALSGPLVVGGHSKGGNLAEYAALVADDGVFARMQGVYNHDGPSFLDDPSPRIDDERFCALLHKTVPESSAFGMILERRADYRVVQSSAMSVFQHEPFTWQTEDDDFVYQEALNPSAVFFDEALDTWLRSKAPDERERFIDTIYDLFASTEAGTWSEFQTKLFANTRLMLGARSKLDPETKSFIWQTLGSLGGILKNETLKRFKPAPPTWRPLRRETYDPEKGTEV
ncbi:Mbeg1-like protein [Eggerthella sinensis]|uniref:Mbeg1-like protein n=1 Tax=Eggerthella sinensis TaxID=242230 RepID=UPI0038734FC7